MIETVLVTGAGGFVGGAVIEALHFAGQRVVKAGIHRWNSAARIARLPVEIVHADVMNPQQLAVAMADVDYVIHCATSGDLQVIPEGTNNVLEAARSAGVKRVVYTSSVAVYGSASGIIDESTIAPPGSLSAYGAAKLRSEVLCQDTMARGLEVVVLRPSLIYGPFSTLWTIAYATRFKSGRWADLGDAAGGQCNLVHVQDVARHAITSLTGAERAGQTFNVTGPEVITWNDYFRIFNDKMGLPPLQPRPISQARRTARLTKPVRSAGKFALQHFRPQLSWLAQKSERLNDLMKRTELTLRCIPNDNELELYRFDGVYSTQKSEQCGLKSTIGVAEGLDMTIAWMKYMQADEF